jgi:hypothetical protein
MSGMRTWIGSVTLVALVNAAALMQAGCGRDEASPSAGNADPNQTTGSATGGVYVNTQPGADADDDPGQPRALPRTGQVAGWVKTRAVSTAPAGRLADLIKDPDVLAVVKAFQVKSLASCRYNQQITSAEVVFIETASPADAFGLVSVLVPEPAELLPADRSVRAVHVGNADMRMAAQQGKVCVLVDVSGRVETESVRRASRRLMDNILFTLPAADPPLLMQVIPQPQQASTKLWLVRDMTVLAKTVHPLIQRVATRSVNQTLGLSGDATIAIAAVPATEEEPAHLIWLAEYPTPDAAKAAYGRCKATTRPASSSGELHLTVLEPKGSRLAGVWTEQTGTASRLLKSLHDALPR